MGLFQIPSGGLIHNAVIQLGLFRARAVLSMITSRGKLVLIYFTNLHRIMGQRRFRMTSFYLVDLEQEKNIQRKEGAREGALLASLEYLGRLSR